MRVLFAGSPDVALPSLTALLESPSQVVGVLTQPPRPVGRKRVVTPTAVGAFAAEHGLPVATPRDSAEIIVAVREWEPEIAIVVAYGRLLTAEVLDTVPNGWWNVHFSLLPRWRGAAPVPHAILAGDHTTGISIFRIDEGLDTGDVALQVEHPIATGVSATELLDELSHLAVEPLLNFLQKSKMGPVPVVAQHGTPSSAGKPGVDFGELDWREDALALFRRIRAANAEPGAFTSRRDTGQRVLIHNAAETEGEAPLRPGELHTVDGRVLVGTGSDPLS